MKFLFIIFLIFSQSLLGQSKLEVRGVYTGENKYMQNPYIDDFIHFCTDSIYINDRLYNIDLNSSVLTLDLISLKIPLGEAITIIIYYKSTCKPKILIPMCPPRLSKIKFDSISLDEKGVISWKTSNDPIGSRPPLNIEQFKFGRWIEVTRVEQKWNYENHYSTTVNFLPGRNIFRINAHSSISDTVYFNSDISPVKYEFDPNRMLIMFKDTVLYEVQTDRGLRYFQGEDCVIDLSNFTNGSYLICYDNETIKFSIRRKKIYWTQQ